MKVIVATAVQGLIDFLDKEKSFNVVASVNNQSDLERLFGSTVAVGDVLLVTEKLEVKGSLTSTLLEIHKNFPEVRIIYFSNGDLSNPFTVNQLHALASAGIYDLYYGGRISTDTVIDYLKRPRLKYDCNDIFKAHEAENIIIKTEEVVEDVSKNNVFAVTSVKPGTGKSFVSSNLAVTLAKYAKTDKNEQAKVLLLEGDLQTLSITTLFGIRDEDYNLKTALNTVSEYLNKYSDKDWFEAAVDEKTIIKRCCLRTNVDNLYVLEGHDFDFNDIASCDSAAYYYLLDYLSTQFDYVIIDCNSSLQHPTTDPIFQLSKTLYFVYTTEYNNIKLNVRALQEFDELGIANKIKFVLNKTLVGEQKESYTFDYDDKEIVGSAGKLRIDFEIPLVDMAVILNSTYNHRQLALDTEYKTLPVRIKFIKLANDISALTNLEDLYGQIALLKKEFKPKKEKKKKKGA